MRLTVFGLMIITLICSVLWEHPAVNVSTVANVDSTEQHFSQISQSIHQPQFEHNDVHHTAENKDDCCDVDCCESNCICIANACAPYSCLATEVHSANALFIIDSVYMPYSESPLFISNSLYRPPITIV